MSAPLDGVRVVDVSNMLMAPYATQILGDMGAEVVKVESPGGDPVRGIGPMRNPGMGAIFLNVNRSKRSLVLDLKHPDGHAAVLELIRGADVLVFNVRPQAMERLGLGYEAIRAVNPGIVYAGLFGYGQTGPYAAKPAFDDLIQGAVSVPWLSHMADGGEPRYAPTAIVDRGVALWAVGQITAALYCRARTGQGQKIEIPMFEMMASFVLGDHLAGHAFEPPLGALGYPRMLNPDRRPYRTLDGFVCVMIYTDGHWRSFFRALGREAEFDRDARYASMTARTQNIVALYRELAELLATRTTAEWLALFERADVPAMPLHTPETLVQDPHLQASGFLLVRGAPERGAAARQWLFPAPGRPRSPPRRGPRRGWASTASRCCARSATAPQRIAALLEGGVTAGPPAGEA